MPAAFISGAAKSRIIDWVSASEIKRNVWACAANEASTSPTVKRNVESILLIVELTFAPHPNYGLIQ